jgi:hypothetical protein
VIWFCISSGESVRLGSQSLFPEMMKDRGKERERDRENKSARHVFNGF